MFWMRNKENNIPIHTFTGFYTKLIVWGSLGLNFEYDGGPIIEIGGPIFLYKLPEDRKKQSLIRLFSNGDKKKTRKKKQSLIRLLLAFHSGKFGW